MIDIHELRIGNWVNDKNSNPKQIEQNDFVKEKNLAYSPISITDKILEKAGFEPMLIDEDQFHLHPFKHFQKDGFKGYLMLGKDGLFTYTVNDRIYMHVHQVQNLYYALTGKELKVKF
jgi:hypothetical protein